MRACRPQSSLIERVTFAAADGAAELGVLTVNLAGRRSYAYFAVPEGLYHQLCQAPSPGRFYNEQIKRRFACREVGPARRFRPA